ncbi:MAG: class I SAM-dependent methyltransferase [Acetobacteraceae bacterium]
MALLRDTALHIPAIRRLHDARNELLNERGELAAHLAACEARLADLLAGPGSPFFHYHASFDPVALMHRYAAPNLKPRPGYLTNFLGVVIDPRFFPEILGGRAGEVEPIPIPANWHTDIAEWGGALRAVDLARGSFTMIELGCGWGCWMNNTGAAARRVGLDVHVIGVEADAAHVGFAHEACADNGFRPSQVTLVRGIAAAHPGIALFPRQERAGVSWALGPVFGASEAERQEAVQSGTHDALPMIPLAELAAPHVRIDLLHVDIQGGEAALVADSLPVFHERVAYLLIGTHSRQIEGRLFGTLLQAGWRLEIERPAILAMGSGGPTVTVDGVQGWRNPCLLSDECVASH